MLLSLGLLFIVGTFFGKTMEKFRLPALLGYLITGIILGPYVLNYLDLKLLNISGELRTIALVVILTRAGLSLDLDELRRNGRPALMLCFVPALFEIVASALFGPKILGLDIKQSLLLGSVLAAVSPAVLVPRTVSMIEDGLGTNKQIPQMLLAGASADDVFVYTMFAIFMSINQGQAVGAQVFIDIPVTIITGFLGGLISGYIMCFVYQKFDLTNVQRLLFALSFGFVLFAVENALKGSVAFSAVLAIITANTMVLRKMPKEAGELSSNFNNVWKVFEILLFSLLAASVDPSYVTSKGLKPALLILCTGLVRAVGVWVSMLGTNLTTKERIFVMLAYIPKATEQAAIGGVPYAAGIAGGEMILTVAVTSIFITAPLGAVLVDSLGPKMLEYENKEENPE